MINKKTMPQISPSTLKFITLGYIIFAGCFVFPFGTEQNPFDLSKAYLLLSSYFIIAWAFSIACGPKKKNGCISIHFGSHQ